MTAAAGVTYGYDNNGNLTTRGASDTFAWDHENRMTESVVGGVTTSYTYNGDGVRVSQTSGLTTVDYQVDVLAPLPVVVQDGTYSYVYGLDLISAIDGGGTEIYYLYDGLGSVANLTDDAGVVTDTTTYDVFGPIRSSSGSTENVWLFAGEQSDGALSVEIGEREAVTSVVSSSNLTGALVANLDDDPDAPDGDWATATALGNTELRVGFPAPSDSPVTGAGLQEFRVLLRKDAAAGTDPTYSIELWETGGGAALATLASAVTLTSETGTVVSVTWDASLLGTADGSAVELRVIGTASVDRSVEVGAVEWDARVPGSGAGLYFLRARYYDPATGRFIGRDPIEFAQRYAYAGNNPVAYTDPSGLCAHNEDRCSALEYMGWSQYTSWKADEEFWNADRGHAALEACGLVFAIGIACDAPNAVWYLTAKDMENAVWAGGAAIPGLGIGATGGKWLRKLAKLLRFGDEAADVSFHSNSLGHIFRNAPGHLADDTIENRSLITSAVTQADRATTNAHGATTYYRTLPNGTQAWAEVFDGTIRNGGINRIPW